MILQLVTYSLITGLFSAAFSKLLDFTLDYGHIFGIVRMKLAKRAAKRLNFEGFNDVIQAIINDDLGFSHTLELIDQAYWKLHKDEIFKGWICVICLGVRMTSIFSTLVIGGYFFLHGFRLELLIPSLVFFLMSISAGYVFILILNKLNG